MDIAAVAHHVLSSAQWRDRGHSAGWIRAADASGELVAVRRGWYVRAEVWAAWFEEHRHVARVIAACRELRGGGAVVSHISAAAVHGWPLFRVESSRVHVTAPSHNGRTSLGGIARHRGSVERARIVRGGLLVTTVERTVADVVTTVALETAVTIADAALRDAAWSARRRTYDEAAAGRWRAALLEHPALAAGRRGSKQGRWVVRFADGRAQLPGESVSRLYLHQLGFDAPRLQVRLDIAPGEHYFADFGLDDAHAWGEFDGEGKYTDPAILAGSTTAQALIDEKWREDRIRRATGRGFLRWGMRHIADLSTFAAFLRARDALPGAR